MATQTYLFPNDVLRQNASFGADGTGLPPYAAWGHDGADWEVDPDITGNAISDNRLTIDDLRSIPTLSLVLPWEEMFGGNGQGIYISGSGSPRAASVELILPDGSTGFQIDGSVQIQGGSSTNRWKSDKLSLRMKFTETYGPTKLDYPLFGAEATDRFDTFILDATLNYGWTHPSTSQTDKAKFIQDQFVANLQNAIGGFAPHARYHHLYINGLYWGMYYVHERPDASFAAEYLGGNKDDYDILKHDSTTVVNGSSADYQAMLNLARENLANDASFQNLTAVLDVDDLIDYMLINFYAGNTDWAHHNWYASFNRSDPAGRWRFHSWDAEHVLKNLSENVTSKNNTGSPAEIHQRLTANAEYRLLFADHVQKHFFHDGALTPASTTATYQQLMGEIDRALVGESARWGDNRVSTPYTYSDWLDTQNDLLDNYFPQRTAVVVEQLRNRNLFPNVEFPTFNQQGGPIPSGFDLTLSAPAGTIYYTLDGSDPRATGGAISSTASTYAGIPLEIVTAVTVRARALNGGEWSALNEATFTVAPLADPASLRITELNYNPHDANPVPGLNELEVDSNQFEFVELQNVGSETIDLSGVQFVKVVDGADLAGITFTFDQQILDPDEFILVVKNREAFESRYGTGLSLAGEYTGKLDNGGERITLRAANGIDIQSFEYDDSGNWPERADGTGSSLETIATASDYDQATNWRSSNEFGGSPGAAGTGPIDEIIVNEILSHSDGAAADLIELYNTTTAPIDLDNWYLSDTRSNLFRYQVPAETSIGAGQYLTFAESQFGFGLDGKNGDDLWLVTADPVTGKPLRFADQLEFDATDSGVSLGRWLDGQADGTLFPMTTQTWGSANSGPVFGNLLISEVHYNPAEVTPPEQGNISRAELVYIELYNSSFSSLDISHWSVQGIDFTFPEGTTVAAGEAIVVVTFNPDAESTKANAFRNVLGMDSAAKLFGAATGQLDNAGENIKLLRPEDPQNLLTGNVLIDSVRYDKLPPWPTEADGTGKSLTRNSPQAFAPFAASWTASLPSPGNLSIPADFNSDGRVDREDLVVWERGFGNGPGADRADGDANGDGDVDGLDFLSWQQQYISPGVATSAFGNAALAAEITSADNAERLTPIMAPSRSSIQGNQQSRVVSNPDSRHRFMLFSNLKTSSKRPAISNKQPDLQALAADLLVSRFQPWKHESDAMTEQNAPSQHNPSHGAELDVVFTEFGKEAGTFTIERNR